MSLAIFILLLRYSTCFGHEYAHLQELSTMMLNYHIDCFFLYDSDSSVSHNSPILPREKYPVPTEYVGWAPEVGLDVLNQKSSLRVSLC